VLIHRTMLLCGSVELRSPKVAHLQYRGADKSLARPGRKQAAPVKSVMVREMVWFGWGRDKWWTLV